MDAVDGLVLVADAASRLGVSQQRIRALLATGDLTGQRIGALWLIDPESIERHRHSRQRGAGRPLAPHSAWAALLTAFDTETTPELAHTFHISGERRARVRGLRDRKVDEWRWLARRRADVLRYSVRSAYASRLVAEPDLIGVGRIATLGLVNNVDSIDAYVEASTADRLVTTYRLRRDPTGNVVLRTINVTDAAQIEVISRQGLTPHVVAVDLLEDRDARASSAGRALLRDLIRLAKAAP